MSDNMIMKLGGGRSAVISHTLVKRIPVNYPRGTGIMYGDVMLFDASKTIRDNHLKVFFCILKAYTDNKYDAIVKAKNIDYTLSLDTDVPSNFTDFNVDTKEISSYAYPNDTRTRPKRILEAMEAMAGLKIYLIDEKGDKQGFVQLVSQARLSVDRKTMSVGINKDFLKDMSRQIIQYDFPTMLQLQGLDFRLYIAMQQRKYGRSKQKYAYTNVDHQELLQILNLHDREAKYRIAQAFQNIGLNFVLGSNDKWFYPTKKLEESHEL